MESSVNLQEPLSYVVWPIVLTGAITAAVLLFFGVCWYLGRRRKMAAELPKVVKPAPMDMGRVKARYLSELADIAGQYDQGKLDVIGAYQRMSRCIRGFVHAATGIRVQNYTLYDIERLNMPELYYLVAEYYAPEFARKSDGDVRASLEKTRSLIERWQ